MGKTRYSTSTPAMKYILFWRARLHMVGMLRHPSLPTPFCSAHASSSGFMALSAVLHSIKSPDNSPLSHSALPVLFLPYWSFQLYISLWKFPLSHSDDDDDDLFMKVSLSPDTLLRGWLGLKHELTNSFLFPTGLCPDQHSLPNHNQFLKT